MYTCDYIRLRSQNSRRRSFHALSPFYFETIIDGIQDKTPVSFEVEIISQSLIVSGSEKYFSLHI